MATQTDNAPITLVIGGTGKSGKRIADRLIKKGHNVRVGSRSSIPSFDWNNEAGWDAALDGVSNIYITYSPDLAMPGAKDAISALVRRANARRWPGFFALQPRRRRGRRWRRRSDWA